MSRSACRPCPQEQQDSRAKHTRIQAGLPQPETMMSMPARATAPPSMSVVERDTRNTPALVQLYFAFLVLNMLLTQYAGIPGNIIPSFAWAVFVIALHKGAINAEALRAGLDAISPNIIEAARASALNPWQSMIYVRLPLAFRFALPALINNLVDLVKMTTLASAIGVGDVTYESVMIWGQRDNALELLLLILVFYMLLTLTVSFCGKWLEQKLRMPGYGQ